LFLLCSPSINIDLRLSPLPKVPGRSLDTLATPFRLQVKSELGENIDGATVLFIQPELRRAKSDEDGMAFATFYNSQPVKALAYARGYLPSEILEVDQGSVIQLIAKQPLPDLADPLPAASARSVTISHDDGVDYSDCMLLARPIDAANSEPFIFFANNDGAFSLQGVPAIDLRCSIYSSALPATDDTLLKSFTLKANSPPMLFNDLPTQFVRHQGLRPDALYELSGDNFIGLVRANANGEIELGPLPSSINYSIKLSD
jgi:hypothetical protein